MNFERMRTLLLEQAIQGKLVPQLESEPEVVQIGSAHNEPSFDIPGKWKWVQLRSVGKVIGGGTPKTNVPANWENGTILWFTPSDLGKVRGQYANTSARKITLVGLKNSAATMMPKDTVLFSSRAPIGHIALAPSDCCTNQGCKSFVANTSYISPLWAYWVLHTRTNDIISRASGTTFKEISAKGMSETWIPLPPIQEQHRIINRIQKLLSSIDSAEIAFTELQSLSETLRRQVLQLAIQGKLVPQLESEPKVNRISISIKSTPFHIPEKWQWCKLSDVVEIQNGDRGKNYPSKDKLTTNNTGLPFVSAVNLENLQISPKNLLYLQPEQYEKLRAGHIKAGDCLLCIRGSLGKFGFAAQSGGAIASSLVILRSKGDGIIFPKFLRIFLQSPFFAEQIKTNQNGTAQPNLSAKDLSNFLMPIPPVTEQQRIVCKFEEIHNTLIAIA